MYKKNKFYQQTGSGFKEEIKAKYFKEGKLMTIPKKEKNNTCSSVSFRDVKGKIIRVY